jgi:hypothetical protein
MARWDIARAAALSLGLDPDAAAHSDARLAKRRALVESHVQAGRLLHHVEPADFLSWAQSNGIDVAPALIEAVRAQGGMIADWRLLSETRAARVAELEAELQSARDEAQSPTRKPRRLLPKEEASLLRMALGMAIQNYGYRPDGGNSRSPKAIADDLTRAGISIDQDTVRKWLLKADQEVSCDAGARATG